MAQLAGGDETVDDSSAFGTLVAGGVREAAGLHDGQDRIAGKWDSVSSGTRAADGAVGG